jgi:hypothetical protein
MQVDQFLNDPTTYQLNNPGSVGSKIINAGNAADQLAAKASTLDPKIASVVAQGRSAFDETKEQVNNALSNWTPLQRIGNQVTEISSNPWARAVQGLPDMIPGLLTGQSPSEWGTKEGFTRSVVMKSASDTGKVVQDVLWDSTVGLGLNAIRSNVFGQQLTLKDVLPGASALANLDPGYAQSIDAQGATGWGKTLADWYGTALTGAGLGAVAGPVMGLLKPGAALIGKAVPYVAGYLGAQQLQGAIRDSKSDPEVNTFNFPKPDAFTPVVPPESGPPDSTTETLPAVIPEPQIVNMADSERSVWNDIMGKAIGGLAMGYGRQLAGGDSSVTIIGGGSGGSSSPSAAMVASAPAPKKKKKKKSNKSKRTKQVSKPKGKSPVKSQKRAKTKPRAKTTTKSSNSSNRRSLGK